MSWAAMARKAKETPQPTPEETQAKKVVVIAVEPSRAANEVRLANSHQLTPTTFNIPVPQKGCLVLDANAFIKGLDDYVNRADVLITIPQVIEECKDSATRDLLDRLPVNLIVLDPTQDSIHKVVDMASATGDLGTLSRTDIRLCAMGLDIATQLKALQRQIKPRGTKINPGDGVKVIDQQEEGEEPDADDVADADAAYDEDDEEDEEEDENEDDDGGDNDANTAPEEPDYGGSDGEGEWINSDNIEEITEKHQEENDGVNVDPYCSGFATATSDFPMQNVLLHLGVPIVGPSGYLIKELRQWLLRCHACFCLVTDTTKQFCPDCGSGNTLKRVAYSITDSGEKQLHINFRRHISTRGNVYSLPKPRGGRNGTNRTLVLREDQLAASARSAGRGKRRAAGDDDLKGFGDSRTKVRDVMSMRTASSYKKYNMNEKKKLRAARRK